MSYSGKIYWHDGLMLGPHHFQMLQKEVLDGFSFQNKLYSDYHYGLIDSSLDHVLLEDGFISFKSFKAIMPSGLAIDVERNAEIAPYNIKPGSKKDSHIVYIGVPLWSPNAPNTTTGEEKSYNTRRMYKLFETTSYNEDTGEDPNELLLRKLNAKLFLDDDDMSGYDVMPVMKIAKTVEHANHIKVIMDKDYIPPVLNLNASTKLKEMAYAAASSIILHAKKSKDELHSSSLFVETPEKQLKSLFRLNTLNEFGVELNVQLHRPTASPFEIYIILRKTLASLSTIMPDTDPFSLLEYNHDNLFESFHSIIFNLQKALGIQIDKQLFYELKLSKVDDNTSSVKLTPSLLENSKAYYIGIETKMNIKELIAIVERGDSFKILPPSLCAGMAVPGVSLNYQPAPNELLPRKTGLYFFMIMDTSDDIVWQKIVNEKEISAVGSMELLSELELTLYSLA